MLLGNLVLLGVNVRGWFHWGEQEQRRREAA